MRTVTFEGCCDFHCWVIKYNCESVNKRIYLKNSLKDSPDIVPLLWQHNHHDPNMVIGAATLEDRDDGVYAYCKLFEKPNIDTTKVFLREKGCVSLAPYVMNVQYDGYNITHGRIAEVSLIFDRVDRHESYFPIMVEGEVKDD